MTPRQLITGILACAAAVTGSAATIVVDSAADENASTPANGNCTLREAVLSANGNIAVDACAAGEAAPTVDLIQIPNGIFLLTIAEAGDASGGSLDLSEDVNLAGRGVDVTVIDGDGGEVLQAVLEVQATVTAGVSDLHVRGGHSSFYGVKNEGTMTLTGCRIAHNYGKGLGNWGVMTIIASAINHNTGATSGGGVYNGGYLIVEDSTVANNNGMGISSVSFLHLERTTVSDNLGVGIGGSGGMEVLNSTISGNSGNPTGVAGGISINVDGSIVINNSTITNNTADYGSGLFVAKDAFVQVQNTVVAGNLGSADCYISGTLVTTGGNIEGPGSSCGFTDPTDQANVPAVDLALGPLVQYGGPTRIHGLFPGSVAIDSGVSSGPIIGCPGVDQRGRPRADGFCDVGSAEVQPGENMTTHIFADGFETGDTSEWMTEASAG